MTTVGNPCLAYAQWMGIAGWMGAKGITSGGEVLGIRPVTDPKHHLAGQTFPVSVQAWAKHPGRDILDAIQYAKEFSSWFTYLLLSADQREKPFRESGECQLYQSRFLTDTAAAEWEPFVVIDNTPERLGKELYSPARCQQWAKQLRFLSQWVVPYPDLEAFGLIHMSLRGWKDSRGGRLAYRQDTLGGPITLVAGRDDPVYDAARLEELCNRVMWFADELGLTRPVLRWDNTLATIPDNTLHVAEGVVGSLVWLSVNPDETSCPTGAISQPTLAKHTHGDDILFGTTKQWRLLEFHNDSADFRRIGGSSIVTPSLPSYGIKCDQLGDDSMFGRVHPYLRWFAYSLLQGPVNTARNPGVASYAHRPSITRRGVAPQWADRRVWLSQANYGTDTKLNALNQALEYASGTGSFDVVDASLSEDPTAVSWLPFIIFSNSQPQYDFGLSATDSWAKQWEQQLAATCLAVGPTYQWPLALASGIVCLALRSAPQTQTGSWLGVGIDHGSIVIYTTADCPQEVDFTQLVTLCENFMQLLTTCHPAVRVVEVPNNKKLPTTGVVTLVGVRPDLLWLPNSEVIDPR
ncbi:hypothetical protein KRX51_09330 [Corynebacterium sp. TAE3-ERU12]|uniref:hypothetical protein n=1 Tax=Corynebacterium sp. TAE3-ERU12 TaxID=2849491 RepID=UPI001C45581D|nr:hypothetical protein [Corynebacterium sp. TAE3-ERU12]MBV7296111.1 hypothetical protein [Corynebacterium sp. TAE3-ERU12]